ncbi:hypothetical protein N7520_004057 [Penicillium odoratum]|uniref:uncharacterized protein n=1 Tax=Penicillium odoratum TaxID=1167516 RepID=UPI0025494267|nr:uncharacterized protein N7520_004057 [Penicillium odoratum]KAJ5769498.1 hypothetical protein N7520_004057 [Penicillium odoratum]
MKPTAAATATHLPAPASVYNGRYDGRYYKSPFHNPCVPLYDDLSLVCRAFASCNLTFKCPRVDQIFLLNHLREMGESELQRAEDANVDFSSTRLLVARKIYSGRACDGRWLTSSLDAPEVANVFNHPAHRRTLRACPASSAPRATKAASF